MNSKALFNATCWFILGDVSMIIAINMPSYVSLGTVFLSHVGRAYFHKRIF